MMSQAPRVTSGTTGEVSGTTGEGIDSMGEEDQESLLQERRGLLRTVARGMTEKWCDGPAINGRYVNTKE